MNKPKQISELSSFVFEKNQEDRENKQRRAARKIAFENAIASLKKSVAEWLAEDMATGAVEFKPSSSPTSFTGSEIKCMGMPGITFSEQFQDEMRGRLGTVEMHTHKGKAQFYCEEDGTWRPTSSPGYTGPLQVVNKEVFIENILRLLRQF